MSPSKRKKIIVVGAGPGGLSSAMILASHGHDVVVYEKQGYVGGRNSPIKLGDFTFEMGPTFVILPQVFIDIFSLAGKKLEDYLDFRHLDPMYRLRFKDGKNMHIFDDKNKLKEEIIKNFPGEELGYEKWWNAHKEKFEKTYACLDVPYMHFYNYLRLKLLKALPVMQLHKSVSGVLEQYFKTEEMRMAMGFQAKYLGMSPWHCPGAFSILSYSEHAYGIFHPMGGVHKISEAMAKVIVEYGGKIRLGTNINKIIVENCKATGVLMENGSVDNADEVIVNADFAYAMKNLIDEKDRPSYKDRKLESMKYSCSTLMFYFGMKKKFDLDHHNIFFGNDYRLNVDEIFNGKGLPSDPAFYLQNPSILDPSLAPEGKSTIYILVPVSNLTTNFDWKGKDKELRDLILAKVKERTGIINFEDNIEIEKMITPLDWENKVNVWKGAVFNLSHNIGQMLYLRPHNRFNDIKNLYLVGGGTHPGSGLPTILESGRIAAELINNS
jgi:phytoene desaturase